MSTTQLPQEPATKTESSKQPTQHAHRSAHASQHAPKKKRGPVFRIVAVALLAGGGCWLANFIHRALVFEETDDAYIAGHVHIVSPRLSESVTEVLVNENEVVKKGRVLARLDSLACEIALQRSKAGLAVAKAGVLQATTAVDQARAEHGQAEAQAAVAAAQLQQAEAQLRLANLNRDRAERLLSADTRTVSKAEVDTVRSAAEATGAAVAAARAASASAEARVKVSAAAIASAQAMAASAQAKADAEETAVRDAERELAYCAITSPGDGRIGNKNIEVGNRVQVGQALFALVDPDFWITANFKETQLQHMHPGASVEIAIDAIGDHRFAGKLESIAPATGAQFALLPPDNATGNFTKVVQRVPVKVVFDRDSLRGFEDRLRPGLSTVVSVRIK